MPAGERVGEFMKSWNKIQGTIEFNPKWMNDTDYLDHAVKGEHAPKMHPGQMMKSQFPDSNRHIILIGTNFGNVVVFERFPDGNGDVIVSNHPHALEQIGSIRSHMWSVDDIMSYVNPDYSMYNIGYRVSRFIDGMKDNLLPHWKMYYVDGSTRSELLGS